MSRRIKDANASPRLRDVFRVVHFSIQNDHLHLVVEAENDALSRGIQGLAIRIARHVNALLELRGSFWGDRFHSRELTSHAKKHFRKWSESAVDPCSSAPWFFSTRERDPPTRPSFTWLGATGWRRHGPVRLEEKPKSPH